MFGRWAQIVLVYAVALIQGVAVVIYPAAGSLLTHGHWHHLTTGEYGSLFLPMIFGAILASLGGGNLAARKGLQSVMSVTLAANAISMYLFTVSAAFREQYLTEYSILLISMLALGLGFGGTLTLLNTYVAMFFPNKTAAATAALHAHLGIGTALAPLLLTAFVAMDMWWGAPLVLAVGFTLALMLSFVVLDNILVNRSPEQTRLPRIFWLFVLFTGIYGLCETLFGNWATIFLTDEKGLSLADASYALSLFWAMVTVGRVVATFASYWINPYKILLVLPLMIAAAFLMLPHLTGAGWNIAIYGFAGLACSACFPLSVGSGESAFRENASIASGNMTAAYMFGYGVAAYGVGVLHDWEGMKLATLYSLGAIPALLLFFLVITLYFRFGRTENR